MMFYACHNLAECGELARTHTHLLVQTHRREQRASSAVANRPERIERDRGVCAAEVMMAAKQNTTCNALLRNVLACA